MASVAKPTSGVYSCSLAVTRGPDLLDAAGLLHVVLLSL
jgi:hypothetical protein